MTEIERYVDHSPEQQAALALTVEDVARALAEIVEKAGDDESAHGMEDGLHQRVLRAVAAGHPDARILAAAALRTEAIEFCRWYA